jgi:hypothetical protein
LRQSVGARHTKLDVVGVEESAGTMVVEFVAIIALDALNVNAKLCGDIGKERRHGGKCLRFQLRGNVLLRVVVLVQITGKQVYY